MRGIPLAGFMACLSCVLGVVGAAEMTLARNGASTAPIVLAEDSTPATVAAAEELAEYIQKISGAAPDILRGDPQPTPASAIWVGFQPRLKSLFPATDFDFDHAEEIAVVCDGRNVAIAGRDRTDGDTQTEFGTANAIYTFIQDYLDVRWLWPGALGEDVIQRETITLPSSEYRFHPTFRQRGDIFRFSRVGDSRGVSHEWTRRQRLALDSLALPGGHAYKKWWDMYHEEHPDYFAMQPDGTRDGFPGPDRAKICMSNPAVRQQWLANAAKALEADPTIKCFSAGENDSHSSGICFCENCMAWDAPDGQPWHYFYEGGRREHVAMSDRYVTFWNKLGALLRERFPDRDLFVKGSCYGPSTPPPVNATASDAVIMGYVGHFPTTTDGARQSQKTQWKEWSDKAPNMMYVGNLWFWAGGIYRLPEVTMSNTIEDFRFLAENSCIGIFVDSAWESFATLAPMYYLMAQLGWDPLQDGNAVLRDYYERGFGPAADDIEAYWTLMEEARDAAFADPDLRIGSRGRLVLPGILHKHYGGVLPQAKERLDRAAAHVANGPEIYRERVGFVRIGYDYSRLLLANVPLMEKVRESGSKDADSVRQVIANWAEIERICEEAPPHALDYERVVGRLRSGYMGGVQDYYGPPTEEMLKAAGIE